MPASHASLRSRLTRRAALRLVGTVTAAAMLHGMNPVRTGVAVTLQAEAGQYGVELLRTWAAGRLPKPAVPSTWLIYAPARGAAFSYPQDWQVTDVTDPNIYDLTDGNPFGAWVVAPDGTAGVLMLNRAANTPVSARDAAWDDLRHVLESSDPLPLADDAFDTGIGVQAAFVAAQVDGTIGATLVQAQPDTVTGGTFLYVLLVVATAERFDATTEAVFLPMLQNLVTDGGSACDPDPTDDPYTLDDCPSTTGT